MMGNNPKRIAINFHDRCIIGIAETSRTRRYLGKRALQVCRRTENRGYDPRGGGLLLPRFQEFLRQLLDPAFRGGKILGGRSCHDYTRFPCNLPARYRATSWRPLANEAVGNATRYGGSMECPDPGHGRKAPESEPEVTARIVMPAVERPDPFPAAGGCSGAGPRSTSDPRAARERCCRQHWKLYGDMPPRIMVVTTVAA